VSACGSNGAIQVDTVEVVDELTDEDLGLKKTTSFINSPQCKTDGPPMGLDSFAVQDMINETKAKLEAQFEEEKAIFRSSLSEKDGQISKLESEVHILSNEKTQISVLITLSLLYVNSSLF
jgi:hypothetical protein